jgi:hypothetical protein
MMLPTPKRTAKINASVIPGMREKLNLTIPAGDTPFLQFRSQRQNRLEYPVILIQVVANGFFAIPIIARVKLFLQLNYKKASSSLILLMYFCTPPFYLFVR